MEETGVPGENHRPVASHWQTWYIMLYASPCESRTHTTSVVIGTDCIGSSFVDDQKSQISNDDGRADYGHKAMEKVHIVFGQER